MYQTDLNLHDAAIFNPVVAAELALRGAERLYEMNASTTRLFLKAQANAAAAFGVPDWSPLFDLANDQTRQVFFAGAERVLEAAQRTSEITTALQRNAGQVAEDQAAQAAELADSQSPLIDDAADHLAKPAMPLNPISEAAHQLM